MIFNYPQICKPHPRIYKMKCLQITVFDILSYINLISYFRNDIIQLMRKKNAKDVFNEAQQNMLIKWMIYIPVHLNRPTKNGNRFMGTSSYPSCLTRMILSGLITIDREKLIDELNKISDYEKEHFYHIRCDKT